MGRSRYKFIENNQPYFMTLTIVNWIPIFTRKDVVQIFFDSLKFFKSEGFVVYAYVILENHIHLIAQSPNINKHVAQIKSFTSREILKYLKERNVKTLLTQFSFYKKAHKQDRSYQFWQEGVHPELIQDEEMMLQKIEYIHQNPVKRGYVNKAEHWCYSSAKNYLGEDGVFDVVVLC